MASRRALERGLLLSLGALLLVFLTLPILALLLSSSAADLAAGLGHPLVWPALRLSLMTTSISLLLVVVLGTPFAWLVARSPSRWARLAEAAVQVPVVVPPAVAGIALLATFGRRGLLAGWLYPVGWSAAFTTSAVVLAEVFVSAPFYAQAATSAFRRIDERLLIVARSFGASPLRLFFRVSLPLAAPGLVAGAAMSWARALGEFGATLMFAGNLQGKTQTLPLAIYTALESDARAARALSILLVGVALGLLVLVRSLLRHTAEGTA